MEAEGARGTQGGDVTGDIQPDFEGVAPGGSSWGLFHGDCLSVMRGMVARGEKYEAVLCDPPYHLQSIVKRFGKAKLGDDNQTSERIRTGADGYARSAKGFLNQKWDGGDIAFRVETWKLVYDCLKPGAYLFAFGGTRGVHRMACAIEDAGFEIRDRIRLECSAGTKYSEFIEGLTDAQRGILAELLNEQDELSSELAWVYGSGMPKSHNTSKGIKKKAGSKADIEEWEGFGSGLKPCYEPIIVARKLLDGTIVNNALVHGCGGLNIDACRIEGEDAEEGRSRHHGGKTYTPVPDSDPTCKMLGRLRPDVTPPSPAGRWPSNLCHDGSDEVVSLFPNAVGQLAKARNDGSVQNNNVYGKLRSVTNNPEARKENSKSASRFFYNAKANRKDRTGSKHATVKPLSLLHWLARLCCPPGGRILDPFAGSGTTGQAAIEEGRNVTMIEREDEYVSDILLRMAAVEAAG